LYARVQVGGSINGNNRTGRLFRESSLFVTGTESRAGLSLIAFF